MNKLTNRKPPQPSCLDAAYERKAIHDRMVDKPVFPENQEYLKWLLKKEADE